MGRRKKRIAGVAERSLYVCFAGFPTGYCIRSISGKSLFRKHSSAARCEDLDQRTPPPALEEVWSDPDNQCCKMGCGSKGSKLYLVGGVRQDLLRGKDYMKPRRDDSYSKSVSVYDIAKRILVTADDDGKCKSPFSIPYMTSPKASTMVVFVGDILYVLAGYGSRNRPTPAFESYDPSTRKWEPLDCPYLLNLYDSRGFHCYAVIGTSIYVSSTQNSFKFDTLTKTWEPCHLFDSTYLPAPIVQMPWAYVTRDVRYDYLPLPGVWGGRPFGFNGQAVLFGDDILICLLDSEVVAYLMTEIEEEYEKGKKVGKVVTHSQTLGSKGLTMPSPKRSAIIADFGNGFFCLVFSTHHSCKPTYVITLKPFRLIKNNKMNETPTGGGGLGLEMGEEAQGGCDDILACEVFDEFNYTYTVGGDYDADPVWRPIGCAVH